jgi:hypothetical protein
MYGYKYLGNTGHLVVTPLTDRIYVYLEINLDGSSAPEVCLQALVKLKV